MYREGTIWGEAQRRLGPFRLGQLALDYQMLPTDIRLVWFFFGHILSKYDSLEMRVHTQDLQLEGADKEQKNNRKFPQSGKLSLIVEYFIKCGIGQNIEGYWGGMEKPVAKC